MTRHRRHAIIAAVVVAVVLVLPGCGDDDSGTTTDSSTTSSAPATTSTTTAPTSTTATTPSAVSDAEGATIVWPDPNGTAHHDEPVAAARAFAQDLIGFGADAVYSEFRQGDSRSGEIGVRAVSDGPETTVLVRQMSDGHWYVIAAVSSEIDLTEPTAGSAIDAPLRVSGSGRAFEGQLQVAVYERGDTTALGTGAVTGGSGEELAPFQGEIAWKNPGGGRGAVVVTSTSGKDGGVWAAVAIPVGFIGAD